MPQLYTFSSSAGKQPGQEIKAIVQEVAACALAIMSCRQRDVQSRILLLLFPGDFIPLFNILSAFITIAFTAEVCSVNAEIPDPHRTCLALDSAINLVT